MVNSQTVETTEGALLMVLQMYTGVDDSSSLQLYQY